MCCNGQDALAHLAECPALNNVDVTNNKLEADEGFLDVIRAIPGLRALSVNGNEVARLPHFRKRLLTLCPMLGYLDRPVDERERYVAAAFVAGGAEAEKAAIEGWREEQVRGGVPLIAVFVPALAVACCRLPSLHRVCVSVWCILISGAQEAGGNGGVAAVPRGAAGPARGGES